MSNHPIYQVAEFMQLGGQYVPETTHWDALAEDLMQFVDRVDEETNETYEALGTTRVLDGGVVLNHAEALDGFLDIAYAAMTGAVRLVGQDKAAAAWNEIVDANLAKVDGRHGEPIIHPITGKIGKPEGWTSPDIESIIGPETLF